MSDEKKSLDQKKDNVEENKSKEKQILIDNDFGVAVESDMRVGYKKDLRGRLTVVVTFLHAIPERIKDLRIRIREGKEKMDGIQSSIDRQEAVFLQNVSSDKATYPNEQSRKSAVALMMDGSAEVVQMRGLLAEMGIGVYQMEYEVERLGRQFSAYLAEKEFLGWDRKDS